MSEERYVTKEIRDPINAQIKWCTGEKKVLSERLLTFQERLLDIMVVDKSEEAAALAGLVKIVTRKIADLYSAGTQIETLSYEHGRRETLLEEEAASMLRLVNHFLIIRDDLDYFLCQAVATADRVENKPQVTT